MSILIVTKFITVLTKKISAKLPTKISQGLPIKLFN